ncbi:MAG: bifunctional DNA primase/polymerase [Armatimonadota bacterium]
MATMEKTLHNPILAGDDCEEPIEEVQHDTVSSPGIIPQVGEACLAASPVTTQENPVLTQALAYLQAGLSVIPIRGDGSKAPAIEWKEFTERPPTEDEVQQGFSSGTNGIGIICGSVSSNLIVIDCDDGAAHEDFVSLCRASGLGGLLEQAVKVQTPRLNGGFHYFFRCEEPVPRSEKLAKRTIINEQGETELKCVIETKGEVSYVVGPGSHPKVHPSGKPYTVVQGDLCNPPVITKAELDYLLNVARSLSEVVEEEEPIPTTAFPAGQGRPGDDFNERGDILPILNEHGWQAVGDSGDRVYLRRPGKHIGVSATYNTKLRLFYVFSTNAGPFKANKAYKPFAVFTLLQHGGDFSAAAKALSAQGYGTPSQGGSSGTARTVEELADARDRVNNAILVGTAVAAYEAVHALAVLPEGEAADAMAKLKDRVGKAINLHEFRKMVKDARTASRRKTKSGGRYRYNVNRYMAEMVEDAVQVLLQHNGNPPCFGKRGTELVQLIEDAAGKPLFRTAEAIHIEARLAQECDFVVEGEEGEKAAKPPTRVMEHILVQPDLPFPRVDGIKTVPFLRPDGTICDIPGLDSSTRMVYFPDPELLIPPISSHPSIKEVKEKVALLDEVFGDFPFDPKAAGRANTIGLLLSPIMEPFIQGNIPLALLDATVSGTGKGLLAIISADILTGKSRFYKAPSTETAWENQFTATFAGGQDFAVFDEQVGPLDSAAAACALTCRNHIARKFHSNTEDVQYPNHLTICVTGNNIRLGGDMPRRCYRIRQDANTYDLTTRVYRHDNLEKFVCDNRGRILHAIYTIIQAWIAQGCPRAQHVRPFPSFNEWAQIIGGVLESVGIEGFLTERDALLDEGNEEVDEWAALLQACRKRMGDGWEFTASDFYGELCKESNADLPLPSPLLPFFTNPDGKVTTFIGTEFSRLAGRRLASDNIRIERASHLATGKMRKENGSRVWTIKGDD